MSKDPNHEWQLQITALVAEIKTNQENLHNTLAAYIESSNKQQEKISHIVLGNGKPGLSEEVRGLKGRWAAVYGICLLVLSAAINYMVTAGLYKIAPSRAAVEATATAAPPEAASFTDSASAVK